MKKIAFHTNELNLRGTSVALYDYAHHNEGTYNFQHKSDFISMCDGMIHGRQQGETFGLAIGEFLFYDKPIILSTKGDDEGHHYMVGDKIIGIAIMIAV